MKKRAIRFEIAVKLKLNIETLTLFLKLQKAFCAALKLIRIRVKVSGPKFLSFLGLRLKIGIKTVRRHDYNEYSGIY